MYQIHSKTLREARFYIKELEKIESNPLRNMNFDISNKADIDRAINQFFYQKKIFHQKDDKYIHETIKRLNLELNDNHLGDEMFSSLTETTRISYFSFLIIRQRINSGIISGVENQYPELQNQPTNQKTIKDFISSCFDATTLKKEKSLGIINEIQDLYKAQTAKFRKAFDWLDKKNEEQCEWVYNYITKHFQNTNAEKPLTLIHHSQPVGDEEKYNFSIGTIDSWFNQHEDTKRIFLIQINKAWNQYKFRAQTKKENRTCLNVYIDISTKNKLDSLSKKRKVKINKLIEDLINNEYDKI